LTEPASDLRDSENQQHHAGATLVWGPDGELIASA
jgi:hypothetical protein